MISEDLCWAIVRMAPVLHLDDIVAFTGVSRAQIFRILALHRSTGTVVKNIIRNKMGRRCHLTPEQVAVSASV